MKTFDEAIIGRLNNNNADFIADEISFYSSLASAKIINKEEK